jgi:hypothetical protein
MIFSAIVYASDREYWNLLMSHRLFARIYLSCVAQNPEWLWAYHSPRTACSSSATIARVQIVSRWKNREQDASRRDLLPRAEIGGEPSWRIATGGRFRVNGCVCGTGPPSINLGRNLFPPRRFSYRPAIRRVQWHNGSIWASCSPPTAGATCRCPVKHKTMAH